MSDKLRVMLKEPKGATVTTSRWRAWWLVRFKGYRVVRMTQTAVQGLVGSTRFRDCWWLEPDGKREEVGLYKTDEISHW